MATESSPSQVTAKLLFRLLPMQILLVLVGCVNGIISSLFAGNAISSHAMSAVGLYGPVTMLLGAISTMLVGGSQILCGKYMGKNLIEKIQNVFSLNLSVSLIVSAVFTVLVLLAGLFDLSGFLTDDPLLRPIFNQYLVGQAAGILPLLMGNQLAAFLSLENEGRRTTVASMICIVVNVALNWLFVILLQLGTLGLALAASLSSWAFFAAELPYFFSSGSSLRFSFRLRGWRDGTEIVKVGLPGAIGYGYQTLRGLIVNALLLQFVGSVGLSAFSTANTLLNFPWAIPGGMLAVSRMLFSVSIGEEDRQSLIDTMRAAMRRYLPLMCGVAALLIALAVPLTRMYYRDPSDPVYEMTVWGFRILPLCMPLAVISMHFSCYGQAIGKQLLVHILAVLDGVVCVAGFTALLIPKIGMNSVYIANVLNGIVSALVVLVYACLKRKKLPRNMEELMVIPDTFGVPPEDRISLTLHSMEDVVRISQKIQNFCLEKGIDPRRSYLAGLCMEEMAGNVILHGFSRDRKKHSVDVRVVYRDNGLILRIKDDCVAFNPADRREIADPEDVTRNIGIRMVYDLAASVSYQSVFGLNVLTIVV